MFLSFERAIRFDCIFNQCFRDLNINAWQCKNTWMFFEVFHIMLLFKNVSKSDD